MGATIIIRLDGRLASAWPEALLALFAFGAMMLLAWGFSLPISLPDVRALSFTGMSIWAPFAAFGLWWSIVILAGRGRQIPIYIAQLFAYLVILVSHFNTKLWMTAVNPQLYDKSYMAIDQMARPVIDASFSIHSFLASFVGIQQLYLFAFLAMYVCSIMTHSFRNFIVFRKLIFASMLVHALGGLSYLVAPAIGPFLFEPGLNAIATEQQRYMLTVYDGVASGGADWIAKHGAFAMMGPPAAMPSLHVASSAVFVWYAWKHERWLSWAYIPLFLFIFAEAMATRWHYLIDLIAGLALTAVCIAISDLAFRWHKDRQPG